MPYGIKDPSSYVSKLTNLYERPINNTACCCCTRNDVAIAPIHIQTGNGLTVTFVCATCYRKFKQNPKLRFEDTEMRSIFDMAKNVVEKKPKVHKQNVVATHVAHDKIDRLYSVVMQLCEFLGFQPDDLIESIDAVSEPAKTVSEPAKTVSEPAKTVSEPAKRGRPRKVTTDSSEMTDDELFAGMSDEQRFKMDEAVALAKMREGMIPAEGGFIDPLDKTKDW